VATRDSEEPQAKDQQSDADGGGGNGVVSGLVSKELLASAALSAAAALAAAKGPSLVRQLTSKAEGSGENGMKKLGAKGVEGARDALGQDGIAGKAVAKLMGGGGGGGTKKTRRLPIQRWTDVAVPLEKTYELWTQFDRFPTFMHRVRSVEQEDGDTVRWEEKIWFSKREWVGKITERRKNDRIAWKTVRGPSHAGIVSFHRLASNLTRVMVTVDFQPTGMMEKAASGLRFVKRAVQADLARFKAFAEMEDAKGLEYEPGPEQSDEGSDDGDADRDSERKEREGRREERREPAAAG
jgi:uncharacterized membrane protein